MTPKTKPAMEHDLYARVVSVDAAGAKAFWGGDDEPVDLGPADSARYREGSRVWGFLSRSEMAEEKATRVWTVALAEREGRAA